jgi:predicted negative regulator of RcsB-dependent stress response
MRSAAKRITRKDIRQPDWFVTLLRESISFFKANRTAAIASAAAVAVVVAAFLAWDLYRGRQNRLAASEYVRAVELYHGGKYKEALEALSRLEIYRSSVYSRLGMLYTANTQNALQDTTRAADALLQLIAKERNEPLLRQAAYISLGYTQEQKGQYKEAVASFGAAENIAGPMKGDATLGKARCSALTGNFKEALASYRKFVTDNPDSNRLNEIAVRIQEMQAKAGEGSQPAK